jgi:AraC-like DNA-binding protein
MSERSDLMRDRPGPDVLPDVLTMAAVRAASPSRLVAGGEWAVRFSGYPHAKVMTVLSGSCWLRPDGAAPVRLRAGDCYLVGRNAAYVTASDLDTAPQAAHPIFAHAVDGVAHAGAEPDTGLLGGSLDFVDPTAAALLDGLGSALIGDARTAGVVSATLRLLADETATARPGGGAMRQHLTQILYVQVLREVLATGGESPRWLAAFADPQVGAALAAMHGAPDRPWTVASLAAEARMSRTVFATRFRTLVGLSPMDYLLRRRITGAEGDLADGRRTVAAVASRWGYGSESAFSAAFKRVTGRSPAQGRTR